MFKKIVGLGFATKGKNAKDVEKYIQTLVEGGATEFFTGYNPPYWSDKFGFEVSPNGRFSEHEQITDFETLKAIVHEVHKHNLEVFINLNAWYYTDETFPLIIKMVEEFQSINIDGIICGNITILEYLKSINYAGKINISTILAAYNTQAISFYLDNYEINKVILSREVTLKEIENIVTTFPKVEFEVFGEGDFCRYNNGLCFAEHKYGAKDICTIVVNDLVTKKRFRPDFKKILQNQDLSNQQKIEQLDDTYKDIFEQLDDLFMAVDIGLEDVDSLNKKIFDIVRKNKNRVDLFFDAMKPMTHQDNKNILIFLKAVKYLKNQNINDFIVVQEELENSIQSAMKYNMEKIKNIGGEAKLRAQELANFYAKGDNLNLYTYLFFSKFPNIQTVKFPTRGRNYNEKLQKITQIVEEQKIDKQNEFDRGVSIHRAHYDLTYLFGEKLWFREMLKKI